MGKRCAKRNGKEEGRVGGVSAGVEVEGEGRARVDEGEWRGRARRGEGRGMRGGRKKGKKKSGEEEMYGRIGSRAKGRKMAQRRISRGTM